MCMQISYKTEVQTCHDFIILHTTKGEQVKFQVSIIQFRLVRLIESNFHTTTGVRHFHN